MLGWLILRRTKFGINLQALGGNESAAWSAGINVTRTRIGAYVASGFCSGLAGFVLAGLTQSGDPTIGAVYLLDGVAAVVIGGTSLAGGVGTIAGSIYGAIALALVSSVLLVSGVSTNYQYIVTGLIVIGALLAHSLHGNVGSRLARRRQLAADGATLTMLRPRTYVRPVDVAVPFVLVAVALVVGAIVAPGFLDSNHVSSMGQTAAYLGIIAIGQTLVLLIGGIDLSVPYTINLAAVLLAGYQAEGMSSTRDVTMVLAIGLGIGLVNGLGIALLDINPLVMTLGMNSILQGITLIYTHGSPIGQAPAFVTTVSTGWWKNLPWVVVLWIGLTIVVTIVLALTTFGRGIYAVGSNRRATELSGLPVKRTIVLAYTISGLAGALGGILLVGYSGQAYLSMGDEFLLPSIAVVVIGGTSIFGGKGSYLQTVGGRPPDHRDRKHPDFR